MNSTIDEVRPSQKDAADHQPKTSTKGNRFFAIDRGRFDEISDLGITAALTYLVIACGTDKNNSASRWSVNAVEKYTGISRNRARAALKLLSGANYKEVCFIKTDGSPVNPVHRLIRYAEDWEDTYFSDKYSDPSLIWLPREIIESNTGVFSPIERLRMLGSLDALMTLIRIYDEVDSSRYYGMNWDADGIRQAYTQEREWEVNGRRFLAFRAGAIEAGPRCPLTWPIGEQLDIPDLGKAISDLLSQRVGMVEFVPHVVDAPGLDGEVLHSLAGSRQGVAHERRLRERIDAIVAAALPADDLRSAKAAGLIVLPVLPHVPNPSVVGILRPKLLARTARVRAWYTTLNEIRKRMEHAYSEF